ncbi:MAG: hypothetical protein ACREPB_15165 [Arenimonas sp.]
MGTINACTQARDSLSVDKSLNCAGALEREYTTVADVLADKQQRFKYGEILLTSLGLGLASFEANIDTFKATGLLVGSTEAFKLSQQYPEKIVTLDAAAARFRCVTEKGHASSNAKTEAKSILQRLVGLSQEPAFVAKFGAYTASSHTNTFGALFTDTAHAASDDSKLAQAILDAATAVELRAIRELRSNPDTAAMLAAIKKAIDDALKLGEKKKAQETLVDRSGLGASSDIKEIEFHSALERLIQVQADDDQALIELAACASA